ncbi:sialin-like [Contarinia nasturtii]|uniref:sialin-like n=1 Tax=Contarinia nasturtii TaxID=265458 RepID=UPI0012D44B86|nr:sialin-like [Contarinia nasturtii]XP_031626887.1 sialin-like [Contarinia nasturtii]XP_031626895.1 sialin-like [Contarinia nasturtii]XP_031626901.1 sialin-like [Contarinia nasturtii]XP_031626908.1 sialin-like [Contarinia nasturtii]
MHSKSFSCLPGVPVRLGVGIMSFAICFITYIMRSNFAISQLAMVQKNNNDTDNGPRYEWTSNEVSWVQGAFFFGNCISTFPAGFITEFYGGSLTTTISLIISVILTATTPITCQLSVWALYANRVILGISNGVFFPALHNVVSKWAPPDEKGKFVAALLGGNVGTVFTFQLTPYITELYGWESTFYGEAVLVLITTVLWMLLVSNTPHTHRFISEKEVNYIETSLGSTVSKEKQIPPYRKIFSSISFISLILLHFGNLWGLFFLLTIAPEYMQSSLNFNMKESGIYSSLPHLARFLAGFLFGQIGDYLRHRNTNSTFLRKFFCIFSHILPGLLLLAVPYIKNTGLIISLLTLSLGFNGSATLTNLQNSQDLAPNFAGTLYSIINGIGFSSGFFGPLLKNLFVHYGPIYNFNPWSAMFMVGGFGYIVPAVLFWFLGTAEVQEWNEIKKSRNINTEESQQQSEYSQDRDTNNENHQTKL